MLVASPAESVTDPSRNPMTQYLPFGLHFLNLGKDTSEITFLTANDVGSWNDAE